MVSESETYSDPKLPTASEDRQSAYRALFTEMLDDDFLAGLRAATNGGWAFGPDRFKRQLAVAVGRRTEPLPAGRKAKSKIDEEQKFLL